MTGFLFGLMELAGKKQKKVLTVHNISYQGNLWCDHIKGWDIEKIFRSKLKSLFMDPHADWNSVNPMRLALSWPTR